ENFEAVEAFPHHPPRPTHYYMLPTVTGGDGTKLAKLLDFFKPASGVDHDLLHAFFLSLFWGGSPGSRPAYLFTANKDDPQGGRGIGKSKVAQMGGHLVGGYIGAE